MPSNPLGERLRQLRVEGWGDGPIKQRRVAEAIGIASPSVSAYENGTIPPVDRLRGYALLFATPRWLEPNAPRQVEPGFLTPVELQRYEELNAELRALRGGNSRAAAPTPFWVFPDGGPVRILCGRLDREQAGRYGDARDPNYMHLRNAADLDSLVELWGHIRRLNPDSDVRYILGDSFTSGDLQSHVIVIGNIAQMQGEGMLLRHGALPVSQVRVPELDGEVFEVEVGDRVERFEPRLGENGQVTEDVGLLARVPNPYSPRKSFTICSGVFTRGVYGAVRCLTDKGLRDDNAGYLRDAFPDLSSFALLMRVSLASYATPTPNLTDPWTRLREITSV